MNLLELASLVITPNAYEEGKLFSVIPSNGTGDLDVVRSTTKTRVNPQGFIETIGINVPSIDYSGGGCPSILLEPQRTNLITFSNDFTATTKALQNVITTPNALLSPDNSVNSSKLIANSANNFHRIFTNLSFSSGSTYVFSAFVKKGEYNFVQLVPGQQSFGDCFANFDLLNGILGSSSNIISSSITELKDGWYRCSFSKTATSNNTTDFSIVLSQSATSPRLQFFTGNNVDGIFVYGLQVEIGTEASSYIPTTSAAVTRNQDSNVKVDDLINKNILSPTEGSIFVKFGSNPSQVGSSPVVSLVLSVANRLLISVSGGTFRIQLGLNNLTAFNYQSSIPMANSKCGVSYNNGQYKIFINGSLVFTSGIFEQKAYTSLQLSDINTNGGISSVRTIDEIYLYKTALSDQECIKLTTL